MSRAEEIVARRFADSRAAGLVWEQGPSTPTFPCSTGASIAGPLSRCCASFHRVPGGGPRDRRASSGGLIDAPQLPIATESIPPFWTRSEPSIPPRNRGVIRTRAGVGALGLTGGFVSPRTMGRSASSPPMVCNRYWTAGPFPRHATPASGIAIYRGPQHPKYRSTSRKRRGRCELRRSTFRTCSIVR